LVLEGIRWQTEINNAMISDVSPDEYNSHLKEVPPGSDGLVLQPYWGPGLSRPLAKGAIIGFSDVITREHFYRAIIEGIAYGLREGLDHFEKKVHHSIPALRVSGGGSQADEICQITADVFNRPVTRTQTHEASSLGAAIAGFLALGVYSNPESAIQAMVRVKDTFTPNPVAAKKYEYLYQNVYTQMYPSLKGIYRSIKHFNRVQEKEARAKATGK
jgi:sugar (pentulose or hexulose) kinase